MNLNNFTIKAQEVIQQAFTIAEGYQHQAIESGHLLKGLFSEAEDVTHHLLAKVSANPAAIESALDRIIQRYPKIVGGEAYLSKSANRALTKAQNLSKEAGDQFVSVEYILLGLFTLFVFCISLSKH